MKPTAEKRPTRDTPRRWLPWAALVGAAVVVYLVPPVRFVALDTARERERQETFDPKAYAERLWREDLPASLDRAVDAPTLLAAIRKNPATARERYGIVLGMGNVYYYYVKGSGRIEALQDDTVTIVVEGAGTGAKVLAVIGNVFGNAVRNATGLADVNEFPNSQDFNSLSLEINGLVEDRVIAPFREKATPGKPVVFAGCVEIMDEDTDLDPLMLVPTRLETE